jgi:PAS domain S-box-containing protein
MTNANTASTEAARRLVPRGGDEPRPTVLCVDDSALVCTRVSEALADRYTLLFAGDAVQALGMMRAEQPDVILCAVEMPRMNGLQLLSVVKGDPHLRTIPFILLTTGASQPDAALPADASAQDFLPRAFSAGELAPRVGAAVRSRLMFKELQSKHEELSRMNGLLAMSRARTRAIIESAHDGIITLAASGQIDSLNPSAQKAFGWSEDDVTGQRFLEELIAPRYRAKIADEIRRLIDPGVLQATCARHEIAGLRRDGREFPLECRLTLVEAVGGAMLCAFVRDLTESKRLEMELQQAQKLEAVGRLAAGIAHEINTPIQYIGDNTRFLEEAFAGLTSLLDRHRAAVAAAPLGAVREEMERAAGELEIDYFLEQAPKTISRTLEGVQRVATIVRAMKEFAHPDRKEMVATDLNRALSATLEVARNEYKYVADVETDFGELPAVTCYAGDLNQVFLNVVVNAAHAIEDVVKGTQQRGTIRVATRLEERDVVVSISDTGAGIPEAIQDRIFDPFFTTKEVGRGTGQGLAIARTIVAKHRGSLKFASASGEGTTFFVRIPVEPERAP